MLNPTFVDHLNGWAWPSWCSACDLGDFALARTVDGGRTWQAVEVPADLNATQAYPYAFDAQTLAIRVLDGSGPGLLTADGGATFTTFPHDAPPLLALLAASPDGWALRCGSDNGFTGGGPCGRQILSRVGSGPVDPQPLVGSDSSGAALRVGGDGRLWIFNNQPDYPRVQVSDDDARSWRTLPDPGTNGVLVLSPDGADSWWIPRTAAPVLLLVNDAWQTQDLQLFPSSAATALGDGILVGRGENDPALMGYRNGLWYPWPDTPNLYGSFDQLSGGTLVRADGHSIWLGIGTGLDRTWIQFPHQ